MSFWYNQYMEKILAKDFKFRQDLEIEVRSSVGLLTPEEKAGLVIEGKRNELERLQLTDKCVFWGIRCVITDNPTVTRKKDKPERGKKFAAGIKK